MRLAAPLVVAVGDAVAPVAVALDVCVCVEAGGVVVGAGVVVAVPVEVGVVAVFGFAAGVVDASGSRYWLSPADGPESASATAGALATVAASAATATVRAWRRRTARVCQHWIAHHQSGFLQDLLQTRTGGQSLDDLSKVVPDQPTETFTTPAPAAP